LSKFSEDDGTPDERGDANVPSAASGGSMPEPAELNPRQEATPALDFEQEFGEPLSRLLDLGTWQVGLDVDQLYARLEAEVADAVAQEERIGEAVRREIVPRLARRPRALRPPLWGIHEVTLPDLEKIHRTTLFTGKVEAVDGTRLSHDSLAVTIIQLGICLVSYQGEEGTWAHRLYRRDLRSRPEDPVDEAIALIEARQRRQAVGVEGGDALTELGTRGLMTYAERAVLTDLATAPWRMGQGSPAPYELLTGAGALRLVGPSLELLRRLIFKHRRFVFVPSAPRQRGLLTLGMALRPLEFLVYGYLKPEIQDMVELGHLRGTARADALDFLETAGNAVAVGVFRASAAAPPYVFYAPADPELCAQAAAIAIADAVLQENRGFPLLLDMADQLVRAAFGREDFIGTIEAAYAAHGRPLAYSSERETRPR
jgi:hypothetical protein